MYLIIGLGNPGKAYERTRHNVGFVVLDALAEKYGLSFRSKKSCEADLAEGQIGEVRVLLAKPQTFMNASGRAVSQIMKKYPVTAEQIIVVYDDADLAFADVRQKPSGSSAGQKGMSSILEQFPNGTNIARVRVGIGRASHPDIQLEDFVLQAFSEKEREQLPEIINRAIVELEAYVG